MSDAYSLADGTETGQAAKKQRFLDGIEISIMSPKYLMPTPMYAAKLVCQARCQLDSHEAHR
jgi:hypothetical protein